MFKHESRDKLMSLMPSMPNPQHESRDKLMSLMPSMPTPQSFFATVGNALASTCQRKSQIQRSILLHGPSASASCGNLSSKDHSTQDTHVLCQQVHLQRPIDWTKKIYWRHRGAFRVSPWWPEPGPSHSTVTWYSMTWWDQSTHVTICWQHDIAWHDETNELMSQYADSGMI